MDQVSDAVSMLEDKGLPRPEGTLSGHAAGLPFERNVHSLLVASFGERVCRQFDALNRVLLGSLEALSYSQRSELFGPPALRGLVARGKETTKSWSPTNLFEEKQDDTAESILFSKKEISFFDESVVLIDVKTQNIAKPAQAPNIISSDKLARTLRSALEDGQLNFDIVYIAVSFLPTATKLVCKSVRTVSLFKIAEPMYINWTAAQQIQFHPLKVDQDYDGSKQEWARSYLKNFCISLEARIGKDRKRLESYRSVL